MKRFLFLAFFIIFSCKSQTIPSTFPKPQKTTITSNLPTPQKTPEDIPITLPTPQKTPEAIPSTLPIPKVTEKPISDRLEKIRKIYNESANRELTIADLYEIAPDPETCSEGLLKRSEKEYVLEIINEIRKLHNLKPVSYYSGQDIYTAKTSLVMAVNTRITHELANNLKCISEEAKYGAKRSNLQLFYFPEKETLKNSLEAITYLLLDGKEDKVSPASNVGHRRWFLNPFQKYISVGRVDTKTINTNKGVFASGMAIMVVNNEEEELSDPQINYVAYPYLDYPTFLFNKDYYLSFSLLADQKKDKNKAVDYRRTEIEITDPEGKKLEIKNIYYDNIYQGLQNSIQWKAEIEPKIKYQVKLKNVIYLGVSQNYEYWIELK